MKPFLDVEMCVKNVCAVDWFVPRRISHQGFSEAFRADHAVKRRKFLSLLFAIKTDSQKVFDMVFEKRISKAPKNGPSLPPSRIS